MVFRSTSTEHLSFESNFSSGGKFQSYLWKAISFLGLLISFIALIIAIIAKDAPTIGNASTLPSSLIGGGISTSCRGVSGRSGFYTIQSNPQSPPFMTYCDMETDQGGWTLVASVHENNIDGKCSVGDKWSSEQGNTGPSYIGSQNWENNNVFGRVESLTSDDYKNMAYSETNATDVMVWHVPNNIRFSDISSSADFKYFTSNKFLNSYGNNLKNLFQTHAPLRLAVGGLTPFIEQINSTSFNLTGAVPGFNYYRYDVTRSPSRINDGGSDMYDGGNVVAFKTQSTNFTTMVYDAPYFLQGDGIEVITGAIYPFVALAWIGNTLNSVKTFDFRVTSNFGADGRGGVDIIPVTTYSYNEVFAAYTVFQVYGANNDPSVCEVYFYIVNPAWRSVRPTSLEIVTISNTTRDAINTVRVTGTPRNIIMGYTLLSRPKGGFVNKSYIENVLQGYMRISENFQFTFPNKQIEVPVTFAKGSAAGIMQGIPTNHVNYVTPGFIQFRAYNTLGFPVAMCPGIKTRAVKPEEICIGGINTAQRERSQCGDFTGWGGLGGDRGNATTPSATGKSLKDINSSILIFTR